jgi:hypothetical protein
MRKSVMILLAVALVVAALPASAELQNVLVGGELRIRANYYMNTLASPGPANLIWPAAWLPQRPIGSGLANGLGILSPFRWDDKGNDLDFIEQRTRLNVQADFTNEVYAFIELDSYDVWGEDFRSNYITGVDGRSVSIDDVEVYQAFVQAENMWGTPFRLRIGRQELSFGSEWLVGTNDTSQLFTGLSFDAIRATYATDLFSVDAWAAMLAEGGVAEEDEDVNFYGVYASYLGLEDITIDAYWMLVRDARSLNDTNFVWFVEWLEDVFGLDDYDPTYLHTIGLRGAGTIGAFDFELEGAYQTGDAGQVGSLFRPFLYGDDGAEYDQWGANAEVGYTFDMAWQPRVYLGYAYLGGEDNRDIDFWDWLLPFDDAEASVSFNRMFSNWEYSEFFDATTLSNAQVFRAGISAMPTESVELLLSAAYFDTLEEFDSPVYFDFGGFRIPIAPFYSFWTQENDSELGLEVGLYATYYYTEDLIFEAGWSHLFVEDGLTDGQFVAGNGLIFTGGTGDEDADYVFVETRLSF